MTAQEFEAVFHGKPDPAYTDTPPKSTALLDRAEPWEMHRDASLSLPPQAAQVVQERRRMTPEERAAVGEFVIQQLSTPQRNK